MNSNDIETPFVNAYIYKTPHLCEMLGVTRMTIYTWEQDGRFTSPRNLHGDRVFTREQMDEIRKAFSPHGPKEWHFEE